MVQLPEIAKARNINGQTCRMKPSCAQSTRCTHRTLAMFRRRKHVPGAENWNFQRTWFRLKKSVTAPPRIRARPVPRTGWSGVTNA